MIESVRERIVDFYGFSCFICILFIVIEIWGSGDSVVVCFCIKGVGICVNFFIIVS